MEERQIKSWHDKAFKMDTVRLVLKKKRLVREVFPDLGINHNTPHGWIRKQREKSENAFPGYGRFLPQDA